MTATACTGGSAPSFFGVIIANRSGIQAERRDNLLAVLQLEEPLDRLAVPGGRRDIDQTRGIRDTEVAEEDRRRARAAGEHRQHRVALAHSRRRHVLDLLLTFDPAVARDDDDVVFFDDEVFGRVLRLAASEAIPVRRASPSFFWISSISTLTTHPASRLVLEERVDLARAAALLLELFPDDQDFESRQPINLQLEDRVGLIGVKANRSIISSPRRPCPWTSGKGYRDPQHH